MSDFTNVPSDEPERASAPVNGDPRPARAAISVKFTPVGRAQTFLLPELAFDRLPVTGDPVVVSTGDGPAVAHVTRPAASAVSERRPQPDGSRQVIRRATEADVILRFKHEQREREAHRIAVMKIHERGLLMKLSRVEQTFDGSRLVFYFTADNRVDFRELVRDLAAEFRTRIEMRQIGVRDEARMLGGYGSCGRPLCCTTWLQSFESVSIKMAKQQNLSLKPSKLSGLCGRLKCCLRYELPNGKGETHAGCAHEGGCAGEGCAGGGSCGGSCERCG